MLFGNFLKKNAEAGQAFFKKLLLVGHLYIVSQFIVDVPISKTEIVLCCFISSGMQKLYKLHLIRVQKDVNQQRDTVSSKWDADYLTLTTNFSIMLMSSSVCSFYGISVFLHKIRFFDRESNS